HHSSICLCLPHRAPPTELYTLSLHDALPISRAFSDSPLRRPRARGRCGASLPARLAGVPPAARTQRTSAATARLLRWSATARAEIGRHTSELQSPCNLVCRLLLEKKKRQPNH